MAQIRLFFRLNGETKFVEVSPLTDELIRRRLEKKNRGIQELANAVYYAYGDVTEELILRYLDNAD